ncbi:MAG: hypothetical protein U0U66_06925 [Cytophagaceae bacterium]
MLRFLSLVILFFYHISVFSQSDLLNFIPKDANTFVTVNGVNLNNKINFDSIRNTDMYKDFIFQMSSNRSAEDRAIVKLFEQPDETGINFKSEMFMYSFLTEPVAAKKTKKSKYDYLYYDEEITPSKEVVNVYLLALSDKKKFTQFIVDLFGKDLKIVKSGKIASYFVKGSSLFYFDDKKLIITLLPYSAREYDYKNYKYKPINPKVLSSYIKQVTQNYSTGGILSNDTVVAKLAAKSDILIYQAVPKLNNLDYLWEKLNDTTYLKNDSLFSSKLIDSIQYAYNINFDNGIITSSGGTNFSSALGEIINPMFNVKPDNNFASLIYQAPVTSYLNYSIGVKAVQSFVDSNFKVNMDTLVYKVYRSSYSNKMENDAVIKSYRDRIDSINHFLYKDYGKPQSNDKESSIEAITDSGTVYKEDDTQNYYYRYYAKEEPELNEGVNWYVQDSLENVIDSLNILIEQRKDTITKNDITRLGIKGSDVWNLFKGDVLFMYHAMTTIDQKYITYETDEEFNTKEVEKTKKIPFPLFSLALSGGDKATIEKYIKIATDEGILKKEGNRYLIIPGNFNSYLWFDGKNIIITNDNNIQPGKKTISNISEVEKKNYERITSNNNSYFIEIGKILASTAHYIDSKETAEILEILSKYFDETESYTRYVQTNGYMNKSYISFNDSSQNSINLMVSMFNEIYLLFKK